MRSLIDLPYSESFITQYNTKQVLETIGQSLKCYEQNAITFKGMMKDDNLFLLVRILLYSSKELSKAPFLLDLKRGYRVLPIQTMLVLTSKPALTAFSLT
jgi:hypothetical protein